MKNLKIGFILPMPTKKIVGGYKVVYEYANYLSSKGHKVSIIYDSHRGKNSKGLPNFLVYLLRDYICKTEPSWFSLSKNIEKVNLYTLENGKAFLNSFDTIIATAAETAVFVNKLKVKNKVYLIQDFENNWSLSYKNLVQTYNYNMKLIVVSKWLKNRIEGLSNKTLNYIPNGIDKNIFFDRKEKRRVHSICMLYHLDKRKDFKTGFEVIKRIKLKYPDLIVNVFGTPKRPEGWPIWVNYTRYAKPVQVSKLMNRSTVFLCTSKKEGFGLTGLESMFCSCIFVTTDCGGINEYASKRNSFISKVGDTEALVSNISTVFESEKVREKIIKEESKVIKNFDLQKSKEKFTKVVVGL